MGLLGWIVVLGVVVFLLARGRKRKKGATVAAQRGAVDSFVGETIARATSARSALAASAVLSAIGGDPEPEVVSRVEELVKSVEVAYLRLPRKGSFEARVEILFEDGTRSESAKTFAASDLPPSVADELVTTGGARVHRAWDFPWAR